MDAEDFPLPGLYPFLKIYKAPDNQNSGDPVWTLHDPVANTYFRLEWAEFECVSRFSTNQTASELKKSIENQTTLKIELEDIRRIVCFLEENGLTAQRRQSTKNAPKTEQRIWQKFLHGYLYFMLPLCRPQNFLERYLSVVKPFLSNKIIPFMLLLFVISLFMTTQRIDEFLYTFTGFFSLEGVLKLAVVFWVIKFIHEMAHAFTAVKNGVYVPHMGVAFIVLYPVLYTETTGAWQLDSRKARFEIGFAGVRAELCLAIIALFLWNIFPAGSVAQSLCFMVVSVALVSSLLVNLNPLMRFDGYYMLSDFMGVDNLQARSCSLARWRLRQFLFGDESAPPEVVEKRLERFLIYFGFILLVYRFFLFTGIAILIYHIFLKPLGLIMMIIELWFFVISPIFSELKIWYDRRRDFASHKRSRYTAVVVLFFFLVFILPLHRTVALPALSHAVEYSSIYSPSAAIIHDVYIKDGDFVKKGEVLMVLQSPSLRHEFDLASQNLESLYKIKQRAQTSADLTDTRGATIDNDIQIAQEKVHGLELQIERLMIIAPFDGKVRDILSGLQPNRGVQKTDLLFRIIDDKSEVYTAYISEFDMDRVRVGDKAVFIPDSSPFSSTPLYVQTVSAANIDDLDASELSSCFGGPIQSKCEPAGEAVRIFPRQTLYRVSLVSQEPKQTSFNNTTLQGEVRVQGAFTSPFFNFMKFVLGGILRESGL